MNKRPTNIQRIYSVIQLVNLAQLDFRVVKTIYGSRVDTAQPMQRSIWRLFASNAFYECVSIMHTLFFPSKNGEVLIDDILDPQNIQAKTALKDLRNKFKDRGFIKIRSTAIDHKNENLVDPAGAPDLILKSELINSLEEIVEEFAVQIRTWFNYENINRFLQAIDELDCVLSTKHDELTGTNSQV